MIARSTFGQLLAWLGLMALLGGCAPFTPPPPGEHVARFLPYKNVDHRTLRMDIYYPKGDGPHPLVFWIHGGGWKYGDKGWRLYVRKLTEYGFAVSSLEYRLSGRAKYPAQYDDCRDGFDFVRKNARELQLDPDRIFLAGTSAGGHLAALLGVKETRARVRAVFAQYPATDLNGFENQGAKRGYLPNLLGGSVVDHRAMAIAASPINFVSAASPPFFFMHGEKDALVPVEQSIRMHRKLLAAGVHSELVVLPGLEHGFPLSDAQVAQVAAFFRPYLR